MMPAHSVEWFGPRVRGEPRPATRVNIQRGMDGRKDRTVEEDSRRLPGGPRVRMGVLPMNPQSRGVAKDGFYPRPGDSRSMQWRLPGVTMRTLRKPPVMWSSITELPNSAKPDQCNGASWKRIAIVVSGPARRRRGGPSSTGVAGRPAVPGLNGFFLKRARAKSSQ